MTTPRSECSTGISSLIRTINSDKQKRGRATHHRTNTVTFFVCNLFIYIPTEVDAFLEPISSVVDLYFIYYLFILSALRRPRRVVVYLYPTLRRCRINPHKINFLPLINIHRMAHPRAEEWQAALGFAFLQY